MVAAPDLQAGIWRHYKGPLYQVFGYAHDANDAARVAVVYIGLELKGCHTGPRLAVRDADEFHGYLPDGRKRFTYVGPEYLA